MRDLAEEWDIRENQKIRERVSRLSSRGLAVEFARFKEAIEDSEASLRWLSRRVRIYEEEINRRKL